MSNCKDCGREEWGFLSSLDDDGYCYSCAAKHNKEKIARLQDENKQLKERLADAEHILDEMGWADRGLIDDYAEKWKWGVK